MAGALLFTVLFGGICPGDGFFAPSAPAPSVHEQQEGPTGEAEAFAHLRGKRIVFLGDSTLRCEYLAIAYLAEYGHTAEGWQVPCSRFNSSVLGPNLLFEKNLNATTAAAIAACTAANSDSITSSTPLQARTRGKHPKVIECKPSEHSWLKFHRYTAGVLGGHETCDCYRENVFPKHCYRGQDWATCGITENRVYRGGSSGAELTMFQWLGRGYRPHGNIRRAGISGALADSAGVAATKRTSEMASSNGTNSGGNDGTGSSPPPSACPVGFGGVEGHSSWTSPNLTHFVHNVLWAYQPTHVVLSSGYWTPIEEDSAAGLGEARAKGGVRNEVHVAHHAVSAPHARWLVTKACRSRPPGGALPDDATRQRSGGIQRLFLRARTPGASGRRGRRRVRGSTSLGGQGAEPCRAKSAIKCAVKDDYATRQSGNQANRRL